MPTAAPNDARPTPVQGHERCRIINLIRDLQRDIRFMKPLIEKPSETTMRFFTPELYLRFNSANEEEANHAEEAWETAIQNYHRHLQALRERMPSQVRKLAELCLHDAELLACSQEVEPILSPMDLFFPGPHWSAVAVLALKEDNQVTLLIYVLWDRLREFPPRPDWHFSKERKHWLYDEVDAAGQRSDIGRPLGLFVHRILFSDGTVLEIPFASVLVHRFPLGSAA
jgi:hypothetical protein